MLEKWGGVGGKPPHSGERPQPPVCEKGKAVVGIRNVSFVGSTGYLIASLDCCKVVTCTAP